MFAVHSFPETCRLTANRTLVAGEGLATPVEGGLYKAQRSVVGLRLPYLPDFLTEPSLVGANDGERLAEVLARHAQFIGNLWKWQNAAFSLRYSYRPARGGVETWLLARVLTAPDHAAAAAQQLGGDLSRLARTFGLPAQEVSDPAELTAARSPLQSPFIAEVRQREDVVLFSWAHAEAYVVYPFWQAAGAFLQPFEALLREGAPCVINLHLEPTELSPAEKQALANAAATAQTAADWQRSNAYSVEQSGRWVDPQAAVAARVYATQVRRLQQPFVMVAQVASSDRFAAMGIAQALAAACSARMPDHKEDELPSVAQLVFPETVEQASAAQRTLGHLMLTPWGQSLTDQRPELKRLRYLADERGAAALFRFPVAVRGGVPGIEVRQPMPDFEPGNRRSDVRPEEIHLGMFQRGGAVTLRVKDLARHGLIAGLPGSGKTNTCLYLLSQLQQRQVPFLVIEPAKTEYRGLIKQPGFENLRVFTLGDETTAPFRLNPFELQPGVRMEVHLEALNVAINAAMPQFGVLPTIIEEALEEVYAAKGWKLTDVGPQEADPNAPSPGPRRLFPTMAEFYRKAEQVVDERGYRGELGDNIRAAVKGRIGSLLRGSKGRMFNCRRSLSFDLLFGGPTVLELDSLNDDAKALTMMFLLIHLREHRQVQARRSGASSAGLRHLLLFEEAHRVMENVASVGNQEVAADTRAKAVRMISDFLVEMRAYGQGVLIAEQSPEKLAPDAVRNTNLKIGHMLPGRQDREALAAAMIMDDEQERFMGKLRVGQAAVFMTGFEKATFMSVPPYKDGSGFTDFLPDAAVRAHMGAFYAQQLSRMLPFDGCRFCTEPCQHREQVELVTRQKELAEQFRQAVKQFDLQPQREARVRHWQSIAGVCQEAARRAGRPPKCEAAYCYLAHEIDFPFTDNMRRAFVRATEALPSTG